MFISNENIKKYWKEEVITLMLLIHGFCNDFFIIDIVSVFLVLILIMLPCIPYLKKLKLGDFEAELLSKEIKEIEEKSEEILIKGSSKIERLDRDIRDMAKNDVNLALAKARMEIENRINKLEEIYLLKNNSHQRSLRKTIDTLIKEGVIAPGLGLLLHDIVGISNRAIHGQNINNEDVPKLIDFTIKGLDGLEDVITEKATLSGIANFERRNY